MRPLFSRRWVLAHLAVTVFVVACIGLGSWQLGKLQDRRVFNDTLLARGSMPVEQADALLSSGEPSDIAYRRVRQPGVYDTGHEFLLLSRSFDGLSGHHVVTPLVLPDGSALLVDRGWVPLADDVPPVAEAAPPTGEVIVEGVLQPSMLRGRFGPRDLLDDGPLTGVFRLDIEELRAHLPYRLEPLYLQLDGQIPAQASEYPTIVPAPPLDEGPYLSYTIQWFLFAAAALVTYAAVIQRARRRRDQSRYVVDVA